MADREREEHSSPLLYWIGMCSVNSSCSLRTPMSNGLPLLPGQEWSRHGERDRERKSVGERTGLCFTDTQQCQTHTLMLYFVMNVEAIWLYYPKQNKVSLARLMISPLFSSIYSFFHPSTNSNSFFATLISHNCKVCFALGLILNIETDPSSVSIPLGFPHRSWTKSNCFLIGLVSLCGLLWLAVNAEKVQPHVD